MASGFGILAFVVLMLFAIFFHELGHFMTARWSGIKASKFFIGFGPTLWSFRRGPLETVEVEEKGVVKTVTRPETEYGIKALPLGGFVKIVGMSPFEEVPAEDEPRSFDAAPAWKRAIVLAAGSVTHFVTAFIVLIIIFAVVGLPDVDRPTRSISAVETEKIDGKTPPALTAGLEAGDEIVSVDGNRVDTFDQVRGAIRKKDGDPVRLGIVRDGDERTITLEPIVVVEDGKRLPVIGIYPEYAIKRQGPIQATVTSGRWIKMMVIGGRDPSTGVSQPGFFAILPQAFSPKAILSDGNAGDAERPISIVGAARIAGGIAAQGQVAAFLLLFVSINIFIGIFNLLPLPPLDGGHLLVLGLEKIRRKKISPSAVLPVAAVVMSLLVVLGAYLIFRDIVEPPQIP
jgi:membrane-associated protease RseP (regulator of RpoE activity)